MNDFHGAGDDDIHGVAWFVLLDDKLAVAVAGAINQTGETLELGFAKFLEEAEVANLRYRV